MRTREECVEIVKRVNIRIKNNPRKDPALDRAWISGIVWAVGGCVNPYHPPECRGIGDMCYDPGD